MSRMFVCIVVSLGLFTALAGCQEAAKTASPTAAAPIEVAIGGRPEFDALLAKQKGKVVLVDFWALWCGPCTENFPHTVELAEKYREQGLATIAVSLDDPDSKADVVKFLSHNQATFDQLISKDGSSSESMEAFDLNSAVPHYRLYDRTGKVRLSSDGLPDDLEEQIKSLLSEAP